MKLRKLLKYIGTYERVELFTPCSGPYYVLVRDILDNEYLSAMRVRLILVDGNRFRISLHDTFVICRLCAKRFKCSEEEAAACVEEHRKNWIPNF